MGPWVGQTIPWSPDATVCCRCTEQLCGRVKGPSCHTGNGLGILETMILSSVGSRETGGFCLWLCACNRIQNEARSGVREPLVESKKTREKVSHSYQRAQNQPTDPTRMMSPYVSTRSRVKSIPTLSRWWRLLTSALQLHYLMKCSGELTAVRGHKQWN